MHTFVLSLVLAVLCVDTAQAAEHKGHAAAAPARPALFTNLGSHHHAITTASPQAQRYFDQGLRLIYGFNHDEAVRAFREAARLDPQCAMAYWGSGYAFGPNYNLPLDGERNQSAYEAAQKAVELAPRASPVEQAYIAALAKRYSLDPGADRKALDRAFADAMRGLAQRYPDDLDAATLFAESLMDLRPWDLWTLDGEPQPGTEEIVATLEAVLQKSPNHPGANHYYIHAVEASRDPGRALPSAERLKTLVPGAGHLVHMPSHVYMRVGRYADATETNRRAVAVDRAYLKQTKAEGVYAMMYYPHNIHFLWSAASMEGRSADAIRAAHEVVGALTPDMMRQMPMLEYFAPTVGFALARFGRWDEILKEPAPPDDLRYWGGLWHYARGLALMAKGKLDEAQAEQAQVTAIAADTPADRIVGDNTPAAQNLRLAAAVLAGELAARRGQTDEAVQQLEEGIRLQDALPYTEPPPWYFPVRQSLGAVLLAAGRAGDAEKVYREDLRRNPENGWSLYGLAKALRADHADTEAAEVEARFRKAWKRADVKLTASRF